MKIFYTLLLLSIVCLNTNIYGQQCLSGGCTITGTPYPSGTFAPTTSWQILQSSIGNANMSAGNYTLFNVEDGNTYQWTYCEDYGGKSTAWDAQLTLSKNTNPSSPICFSSDQCGASGLAPFISWTANFTGVVRLLTTAYVSGGCKTNSGSPYNQLAYKKIVQTCMAPTNVTTSNVTQNSVKVAWTAPQGTTATYLRWKKTTDEAYSSKNVSDVTSYTISDLICGFDYDYFLISNCLTGGTQQVGGTFSTSSCSCPTQTAPTANEPSNQSENGFSANWSTASGASGYTLDVSTNNSFSPYISGYENLDVGNALQKNVTGLSTNTTYYYRVKAYNSCGNSSGYSSVKDATTSTSACINSVSPTSASANPSSISSGSSTTLTVNGGTLGTGASWRWYSGSCGETLVSTGSTISVSPTSTTTYYVRAEGGCSPTTSCANATVTVYSVAMPTVSKITFTNVIEKHKNIEQNFTLYSESPTITNKPIKICADGSASTYITVDVSDVNDIAFRILDGGVEISNSSTQGELGTPYPYPNGKSVEVIYTHPQFLVNGLLKSLTLQVLYKGAKISGIDFPLQIYPAPVLFVHGWRGQASTFDEMEVALLNSGKYKWPITHRHDYSYSNTEGFEYNLNVVSNGIDDLFNKARSEKFSMGKVDVVAHSMGGVLSRLYLQASNYRNDIHKLITLNTPHSGSQGANFLYGLACSGVDVYNYIAKNDIQCYQNVLGNALRDMRVNSNATRTLLNGASLNRQHKVPSFAISTNDNLPFDNDCLSNAVLLYGLSYNFVVDAFVQNLFNEENDLVVAVSSQQGGLNKFAHISEQCHLESTRDSRVIDLVKTLLEAKPDAKNFSLDGFHPPVLDPPLLNGLKNSPSQNDEDPSSDSLIITNIHTNEAYNPGQQIIIDVKGSSRIKKSVIAVGNETVSQFAKEESSSIFQTPYAIPIDAFGKLRIICVGYDSVGFVAFDTVSINILSNVLLDSISSYKKNLRVEQGEEGTLNVDGYFNDGISRDISFHDSITYIIDDTSIVKSIGKNNFQGNKLGTTNILISFRGKTIQVPVEVFEKNNYIMTVFKSDKVKICVDEPINFSDISIGNSISRTWSFPGGTPSTSDLQNPIVNYAAPGTYPVTLIATYPNQIDTLYVGDYITVSPLAVAPYVSSMYTGDSIILISSESFGNSWFRNDTLIYGANRKYYPLLSVGAYKVKTVNTEGCESYSNILNIPTHFVFNGNGNWDKSENWGSQYIHPPSKMLIGTVVTINPVEGGQCVIDRNLEIPLGTKLHLLGETTKVIIPLNQDSIFTDPRDGQKYNYRQIGSQIWMTQNLNYSTPDSWCYGNDSEKCNVFGRLYTGNAAITAPPPGWHLPSNEEWDTLIAFLGDRSSVGGAMKSPLFWNNYNFGAVNSSGFAGFGGGIYATNGNFYDLGTLGYWWSSTKASEPDFSWAYYLHNGNEEVTAWPQYQMAGISIRCVRDK